MHIQHNVHNVHYVVFFYYNVSSYYIFRFKFSDIYLIRDVSSLWTNSFLYELFTGLLNTWIQAGNERFGDLINQENITMWLHFELTSFQFPPLFPYRSWSISLRSSIKSAWRFLPLVFFPWANFIYVGFRNSCIFFIEDFRCAGYWCSHKRKKLLKSETDIRCLSSNLCGFGCFARDLTFLAITIHINGKQSSWFWIAVCWWYLRFWEICEEFKMLFSGLGCQLVLWDCICNINF